MGVISKEVCMGVGIWLLAYLVVADLRQRELDWFLAL